MSSNSSAPLLSSPLVALGFANTLAKNEAPGQMLARSAPALSTLPVEGYDGTLSALHFDRCGFGKLELERRLRPKLDVFLACHSCNRRAGARSHGSAG